MKIAVIGTGSVGRRHIENLLAYHDHDILAVSEHSQRSELIIGDSSVPLIYSMDDALKQNCDAIIIANPTIFHLPCLRKAIAANCHVYLEKPVSVSAAGLEEIAEDANRRSLVVAVGTQNRFHERLEDLQKALKTGAPGLILNVVANLGEHIADYHPREDYRTSYTARAELGGGILLTQIHQIDYLNWLFGPFTEVAAIGGKQSQLDIDVEDSVTYLLYGSAGVPVIGHMDYLQRPKRVSLEVIGSDCSYRWDYFTNRLETTPATLDAETTVLETPFDRNALFQRAMDNFLKSIENESSPRSTLKDGIDTMHIVDAIRVACKTRKTVSIQNGCEH
jgi:predicted dehydrogenase